MAFISPWSQALARLQTRFTVLGETPSRSAVCSTVSPPKNRSSTILPCLSSSLVSRSGSIRPAPPLRSCVQLLPLLPPHPHRQLGRHSTPVMGASRSLKSWSGGRPHPPGKRLDRPTAHFDAPRKVSMLSHDPVSPGRSR